MPTEQDRDDLLRRLSRFEKQFFPRFAPLSRQVTAPGTPIEVDAMHWARLDRAP